MQQSIIVYRNPAEAMFWESDIAFPIMVSMFVIFIVALAIGGFLEQRKFHRNQFIDRYSGYVAIIPALIVGIFVYNFMV